MYDDDQSDDDSLHDSLYPRPKIGEYDCFSEQWFGIYAPDCARHGWSIYPQMRDERRRPCKIDEQTLEWGRYQDVAPTPAEIERWRHQVLGENVALILGRASGNVFCVDVDVDDEDLSWQIEMIANDTLGPSNWRRIGNPPKVAILYRAPSFEEMPSFRRCVLTEQDGITPSRHVIEILGHGRSITAFGRHWKTGLPFEWSTGFNPMGDDPDKVPEVTREDLERFFERVQAEVRRFVRPAISVVDFAAGTERYEGTVIVPNVRMEFPKGPDGKIVDGREGYLYRICELVCRRNAAALATQEGAQEVRDRIVQEFMSTAATTGRWHALFVRSEVVKKCKHLADKLADGRLQPLRRTWRPKTEAVAAATAVPADCFDVAAALIWLPRTWSKASLLSATAGFDARAAAIDLDPEAESERVAEKLDAALDSILDDLLAEREAGADKPAHLLKVPTGAGKTSRLVAKLADRAVIIREERQEPLRCVLAVPAHENADEVLARAEEAGLVAMVYKGKLRPGMCARQDVVRPLQEAGIGTAGICHARVESQVSESGWKEVFCPFYESCAYQKQKAMVADCDLVIVPHAYLGLGSKIPEVIAENARIVVVDEDLSGTVLHAAQMPIRTLTLPRNPPTLTKQERKAGIHAEDHLEARGEACAVVIPEIEAGRDPALALLLHARGLELIDACIAVCGRSDRIESKLTPLTPFEKIEFYAGMMKASYLRQEWRFWKLMRERYLHCQLDLVAPVDGNETRVAKGETDARIRRTSRWIRLAWMTEPALRSLPTLYMDASAEERVVRKIVGREITTHAIDARIRQVTTLVPDATFSKSSLLAREGELAASVVRKGKKIARIRQAIAGICAHHGDGVVVCVAPKALREHITGRGKWPTNLKWLHYGATRGLDYCKDAVALISVGDLNARLESYDDLCAALTYDEDVPEPVMVAADGSQPAYRTVTELVPMRDGRSLVLDVNRLEGEIASTFQRSVRDHEILQAWGRLRPIHRLTPGYVYHFGRTVPAGTTLDAVVSLDDLVAKAGSVGQALVDGNGVAERHDVPDATLPQFDATVAAVDADPSLHPGLAAVRDADGNVALVMRTAGVEEREMLLRQGYDLAAAPAPVARPRTDADLAREQAEAERRWSAWEDMLDGVAGVQDWMRQDDAGMWWIPDGRAWGVDRKGNPEAPVPMTMDEALEVYRARPLPAIGAADPEERAAA